MASQPRSSHKQTSSSASGSNPQRQPEIRDADTATAAESGPGGGLTSGQQTPQQQAGQGRASQQRPSRRQPRRGQAGRGQTGQGQTAWPSSAVRETTVRSYDPHAPGAQQAQTAAVAGPWPHVRETTSRAYGPSGERAKRDEATAAGPSSRAGPSTARAPNSSAAVRPSYAQAATPKQSLDALSGRLAEMMLNDGPTPCRGPAGTTAHPGGGAPSLSSPVYGAPGDERVYTHEERNFVLRLLDEGKNVYYIAKVTGIIIKTVQKWQKWQKELQQGL